MRARARRAGRAGARGAGAGGRSDVVLNAMFAFAAVLFADGEPFAVADGDMREVETPPRPASS